MGVLRGRGEERVVPVTRRGLIDAGILVFLAAAAFLFWQARVIAPATEPEGLFLTDFYTLMAPMYRYGFAELTAGRVPLWNPYTYCGIPFLATLYTGILYPGNFLFLLLPTGLAMGMTVVLHTFLAAWFMYLLGRAWEWSRTASGVAAVTWAFTHNAVWFFGPICFLASGTWIPFMILGIERSCQRRIPSGAVFLAIGGAMSLLAGGLQVFVYGVYALAIIAIVRLWSVLRRQGGKPFVLALGWLGVGAITALCLAAPQILPSWELATRTQRAPGNLSLVWADNPIQPVLPQPPPPGAPPNAPRPSPAETKSYHDVAALWTLIPRESPGFYFGILPPILAVAALFGRRRGLAAWILAGAALAALLSIHLRTPLFAIYHALPTGAWFRNTYRFAILTGLGMAALAGLGVTSLETGGHVRRRTMGAALAAAAAGVIVLAILRFPAPVVLHTGAAATAGLALAWLATRPGPAGSGRVPPSLLVIALFLELCFAYRNPYIHPQKNDLSPLDEHRAVTQHVRAHVGSQRVAIVDEAWGSWAVQSKYGLLHRVRTLNDFEPLTPSVYGTLFPLLDGAPPETRVPFDGRLRLDPSRSRKKILDLLSVRYILVDRNRYPPWDAGAAAFGLRRIPLADPEIAVFENPAAQPRATLVENAVLVASEEEAARILADPDFDPRRVAVVESAGAAALSNRSEALRGYTLAGWKVKADGRSRRNPGTARIVRDDPDRVELDVEVAPGRAGWLVLMDLDWPGWRATVNGRPAVIVRANLVGRGLRLAAGSHRVVFTYEAASFRLGCLVALLAACLWAFGALAVRAAGRRMGPGLLARRILPWLVAFGILALLVRHVGMASLRAALAEADLRLLLVSTLLCTLPMYLLDVLSLARVITWFNRPISFREIAPVKAAIYLLNIVNYNAGSGAVALWLKRRKGIPFLEGAASVLFVNVVDAALLVVFMAAGLPALSPPLDRGVALIVAFAGAALAGHFLYWRGGVDFIVLGRLRGWPIFRSFRLATFARYLRLAALRVPFDLFFILNFWLALRAFGIEVPFLKALAYVPLILFIAVVPVTVSGLGTVQAATVFLFSAYASDAKILAFSLAFTVVLSGVRAALGVPVFRRVSDEIFSGSEKQKEDGDQVAAP